MPPALPAACSAPHSTGKRHQNRQNAKPLLLLAISVSPKFISDAWSGEEGILWLREGAKQCGVLEAGKWLEQHPSGWAGLLGSRLMGVKTRWHNQLLRNCHRAGLVKKVKKN